MGELLRPGRITGSSLGQILADQKDIAPWQSHFGDMQEGNLAQRSGHTAAGRCSSGEQFLYVRCVIVAIFTIFFIFIVLMSELVVVTLARVRSVTVIQNGQAFQTSTITVKSSLETANLCQAHDQHGQEFEQFACR
ncbi:MAG: hypothetical protein JNJ83_15500 [Verrucomicrobiaceae bacterium]|nr:hypothetical protein [Verrucomicrobiaceae bacterium]